MSLFSRKPDIDPELLERMKGQSGSVGYLQGPSGCGKTHKAFGLACACAAAVGGKVMIYDPMDDCRAYHEGSKLYYINRVNETSGEERQYYCDMLDFYRYRVIRHAGICAGEFFNDFSRVVSNKNRRGMYGAFLVDESAVARNEKGFLETMLPLVRNVRGFAVITGQRWMATPPQVRALARYRIVWRSSDYTGDSEIESLSNDGEFQFTQPMSGDMPESERNYHCVYYGPGGPEHRVFNPYTDGHPDWTILPALPTTIRPMMVV